MNLKVECFQFRVCVGGFDQIWKIPFFKPSLIVYKRILRNYETRHLTDGGRNRVTFENIETKYRTDEHFMSHFSFRRNEVFELLNDLQV